MCALANITQKVAGSDTYNERKILADDVNQIREAIQTGAKDIKPNTVQMVGNTITADNGSNWIRRNNNTFQFHNGSSWQEPETATLLTFTAGENIAARDVVYLKVSDGKIYKASTANNDWIGVATAAISSSASGTIYPNGSLVGGFSALTSGTWYGLNATAGTLTANENYIVGLAISATQIILVKPKGDRSTRDNDLYKLQGEKAINDVSATNSGVLAGSSQVLIDKFLDSSGQNNTVDTTNTTGLYDITNYYYGCYGTLVAQAQTNSLSTTTTTTTSGRGLKITANSDCILYSVTKARSTGNQILIKNTGGTVLATYNFGSTTINPMILSPPFKLTSGQSYRVELKNQDSGSIIVDRNTAPSMPVNNTYINYITGSTNGSDDSTIYCFTSMSIKHTLIDSIVQSTATTIPTGMTEVCCVPLMYEALTGSDDITFDVSIDNGAHYTTAVPINTWTPITSANGTQLIIKMNLDTASGTTTPRVLGWRVLLE